MIEVVAAILVDDLGRTLMVRKHDTLIFMQPGGKPEEGETPMDALLRELHEELGLVLEAEDFTEVGVFEADAANEPGHRVRSHAFWCHHPVADVTAAAEIAEARWLDPWEPGVPVAPLSAEFFLPRIRAAHPPVDLAT